MFRRVTAKTVQPFAASLPAAARFVKLYTETHEWVDVDAGVATIGVSKNAAEQLGKIVYVGFVPAESDAVAPGDELADVESVKAASKVYSPLTGTVETVNEALDANPALLNTDPEGEGWLCKIKVDGEVTGLMDEDAYKTFLEKEEA